MNGLKTFIVALAACLVGFGSAVFWMKHQTVLAPVLAENTPDDVTVSEPQKIQPAIRYSPPKSSNLAAVEAQSSVAATRKPEDILEELAVIHVSAGPNQGRSQYRILTL